MSWYNPFSWDMVTNANVPTQYTDRSQIQGYVQQGMGPGGIANQQAPQLMMGSDPFRAAQLQQMQQLQGIASGQQQGAGELAAQRQIQQALAAQQAQARMARGGNAAMAYRNAANQSAALGLSGVGMGQQAAMQDQMQAHGLLSQVGSQGRVGDFSTANANAGYQQGTQQNNAGNYLNLMNQLGNMSGNELNVSSAVARDANAKAGNLLGGLLAQGGQAAGWASKQAGGGGGGTMPDGGGAVSDERAKTKIVDARHEVDELLDSLGGPKSWTYKDQKHGKGHHVGIIIQDMEKSRMGREVASREIDGYKAMDVNKALSAALASSARLNERVRDLEGKAK